MASKEALAAAQKVFDRFADVRTSLVLPGKEIIPVIAEGIDEFAVGERNLYAQAHAGIAALRKEMARTVPIDANKPIVDVWRELALERDRLKFRAELLQEMVDRVMFGREKREQEPLPPAYQEDDD